MNLQGLLRVGAFNVGGVCENRRFWPPCRNILQTVIHTATDTINHLQEVTYELCDSTDFNDLARCYAEFSM